MEVTTQNFDEPAIDWTKANLLESTRIKLIVINDPTVIVNNNTFSGTVLSYQPSDPGKIDFISGKYLTDFNPLTFKMFNGQINLSNS